MRGLEHRPVGPALIAAAATPIIKQSLVDATNAAIARGVRVPTREGSAPALVDVAHWAAESTWLPVLRERLVDALGDTVEVHLSSVRTDPWTFTVGAENLGGMP